jgi:regulator of RNase E activity RraA
VGDSGSRNCSDVKVNLGDILMGDDDCVIVDPKRYKPEVLKQVELMREA